MYGYGTDEQTDKQSTKPVLNTSLLLVAHSVVEGLVGSTSTLLPGTLNETGGGWLTGGTAPSQLLPAAGQTADQALMAAIYQQQPAAIQQVYYFRCILYK